METLINNGNIINRYIYNCYMWLCDFHPDGDTEYRKNDMIFFLINLT